MTSLTEIIAAGIAVITSHTVATGVTASREYKRITQNHPNIARTSRLRWAVLKTLFKEETAVYSGMILASLMFAYLYMEAVKYN